jgi:hypothetical protein
MLFGKYGFHCINFHKTQNYPNKCSGHLLFQILAKPNETRKQSNISCMPLSKAWLGVKGMSAGSRLWSGHCREVMAPAPVGPGMGQPIGVATEVWWLRSNKSAASFSRGDKCVIQSLFSPKTVCAWQRAITYKR